MAADFRTLLGPSLLKLCPRCIGRGKLPLAPWIACEPCDGSGWVPTDGGRAPLDVLGDGEFRLGPDGRPGVAP